MKFYDWFVMECAKNKKSVAEVVSAIGISSASATGWKKGSEPKETTIKLLEDYFGESFKSVESSLQRARDVDRVLFEVTADMTVKEVELLTEFARSLKNANRGY